ncbi:HU family DNA-binding protein [Prevotella salivae]|uniref:HU family DNA-binding protein n=1 Tax=Segatella salivae TaxID=228604 RepID=A0AAW4NKL3_9BACT|nr:HU family DNA-binding protein [Segatella salivae]MBW4864609.1 HU family DNA-binding protein [Segatella salivae]MBW4908621.1 HU family DNA-binding protein [Segatella salivae]
MTNIKDLARFLVEKHGIKLADAELFIALMTEIINEGVHRERQVKIKGLGTFKLTSVSSRESIDVNTGERIVIEGRDKLSFAPDNAMKELVNQPFSQFETIVVNDGVELEDEYKDQVEETAPAEEKKEIVEEKAVEEVEFPREEPVKPIAVVSEMSTETMSVKEEMQEDKVQETISETNVSEVEQIETAQETIEIASDNVAKAEEETLESSPEKEDEPVVEETDSRENDIEDTEDITTANTPHKSSYMKPLVVGFVALFVVLIGTICFMFMKLCQQNEQIYTFKMEVQTLQLELLKKQYSTMKGPSKVLKPVAVAEKLAPAEKKSVPVAEKPTSDVEKPVSVAEKSASSKEEDAYEALNKSDARVRTGAYRIVGVKQVIKVKRGQTLSSISRLYLGPGMECYIEVMNKNKELKEGDRVKIPELKRKHRK